jgi:hypothetical protein
MKVKMDSHTEEMKAHQERMVAMMEACLETMVANQEKSETKKGACEVCSKSS